MGQPANVTSLDAVDDFRAALVCFKHEASTVLEGLEQQIYRLVQWIQQDQRQYWRHQSRRNEQQLQEAKLNLQRCLMLKQVGDQRPACIEEKRALERAKRRQQACREKTAAVRKWSRAILQVVFEYKAGVGPLRQWLETDAPQTLALLERIRRTLEEYVAAPSSPQAAEAMERLPWTGGQPEISADAQEDNREKIVAEEDSSEQPGETREASDGGDVLPRQEHGSQKRV
jgi:hypothetical protein